MSRKLGLILESIFPRTSFFRKCMTAITIYSIGVWWLDDSYFPKQKFLEADACMATSSIVIGLLLVFRTNSAYERWWEGRKLWGQLVNDLRNLRLKIELFVDNNETKKEEFRSLLIAFPYALKEHLRGHKTTVNIKDVDSRLKRIDHLPYHLAGLIYSTVFEYKTNGQLDGFQFLALDPHLRALMDICGACERIRSSPIALSYKTLIWAWLIFYILVIPWLLVPIIDFWALLLILIGSYFVLALELVAEEVEEPFGIESNDLPLDAICQTIEKSIRVVPDFDSIEQ
jgi:ion channel-forming bestrophin family protein